MLKSELYSVKNSKSEREKAIYFAMDRILTGIKPQEFIDHLNDLRKLTKSVGEKMRYANDIRFVKSKMKNDTV